MERNISAENQPLVQNMEELITRAEREIEGLKTDIRARKEKIKEWRRAIKDLTKGPKPPKARGGKAA
jgi:peptidoglycan hydrolase CwlO-like protein